MIKFDSLYCLIIMIILINIIYYYENWYWYYRIEENIQNETFVII